MKRGGETAPGAGRLQGNPQGCQPNSVPNNNGSVENCDGKHSEPKLLEKSEVDFCRQNSQKFNNKKYCINCQLAFAKGNLGTGGNKF